jgi:hypothetical protein
MNYSKHFPERKISETFLEYAAPLFEMGDEQLPESQLDQILRIAFVVWNALVYEAADKDTRFVDQLDALTSQDPLCKQLTEMLIDRKKRLFAEDYRIIGKYRFTYQDGNPHIWVEARRPSAFK